MLKPGDSLGRYEIDKLLARGGMAEVWLAVSRGVGGFAKKVVLKTILPDLAENPDFVRMFINEALLAARLNHPNIVQIFDLGQIDGRYFIAMEYVPGRTLRQISRQCRKKGQLIPPWFVLRSLAIVCEGLQYAHDQRDDNGNALGLVHRDITPENIMITFTGTVKILDFGVAKATAAASLTRAGTLKGKYAYISPEQVHGAPADRRSDVYSVGVMLYELLTGSRPFRGTNDLDLLRQVAAGNPAPARELAPWIPEEFNDTIMLALAKRPEERYGSASDLGERLLAFLKQAQDHRGQREMGLFVSGIYPDDPNIPSDILKSLAAATDDSAASGVISHASVLSATFSSVVGGSSGSSGAGQPSIQTSHPSALSSNLDVAFVPAGDETGGADAEAFGLGVEDDTNATTRGGAEEGEGEDRITGFEEWAVARKDGRMQLVAKTQPQPHREAVDERTPTRTYEPRGRRKKSEDEDIKTDPSGAGVVERAPSPVASTETLVSAGGEAAERSDTADSLEAVTAPPATEAKTREVSRGKAAASDEADKAAPAVPATASKAKASVPAPTTEKKVAAQAPRKSSAPAAKAHAKPTPAPTAKIEQKAAPRAAVPTAKTEQKAAPRAAVPTAKTEQKAAPKAAVPTAKIEQNAAPKAAVPTAKTEQKAAPKAAVPTAKTEQKAAPKAAVPTAKTEQKGAPKAAVPTAKTEQKAAPKAAVPTAKTAEKQAAPAPAKKRAIPKLGLATSRTGGMKKEEEEEAKPRPTPKVVEEPAAVEAAQKEAPQDRPRHESSIFDAVPAEQPQEEQQAVSFLDTPRAAEAEDRMAAMWTVSKPREDGARMADLWSSGSSQREGADEASGVHRSSIFETRGEDVDVASDPFATASEDADVASDPFATALSSKASPFDAAARREPAAERETPFSGGGGFDVFSTGARETRRDDDVFAAKPREVRGDDDVFTSFARVGSSARRAGTFGDISVREDALGERKEVWAGPIKQATSYERNEPVWAGPIKERSSSSSWFEDDKEGDKGGAGAALFEEGLVALRAGRLEEALDAWTKAIDLEPDNRTYQSNMRMLKKRMESER